MHINDYGSGAAVVLLHGSPTAPEYFDPLVETLAGSHRVLVPEFPGYGRSPPLSGPRLLLKVQQALEAQLVGIGVTDAAFLGFSAGAYRTLWLALSSEKLRVNRIILHGGFAGLSPEHKDGLSAMAAALRPMTSAIDPALKRHLSGRMLSPEYAAAHPEALDAVGRWMEVIHPTYLADELESFLDAEDLTPLLPKLRAPLTVRVGRADAATPIGYSEHLARVVPHAKLEVVEGCGHALLIEDREQTIQSVRRALSA